MGGPFLILFTNHYQQFRTLCWRARETIVENSLLEYMEVALNWLPSVIGGSNQKCTGKKRCTNVSGFLCRNFRKNLENFLVSISELKIRQVFQ